MTIMLSNQNRIFSRGLLPVALIAASCLLVDLVITHSVWAIGATLICLGAGASFLLPNQPRRYSKYHTHYKRFARLNRRFRFIKIALISMGTVCLLHAMTDPASAIFYEGAEKWLTTVVSSGETDAANTGDAGGAAAVIGLTFNVLRGLFVLYIGISVVKVVNAARQDEDWQNLARTPLIVLLAVTVGDLLVTFVVGDGETTQQASLLINTIAMLPPLEMLPAVLPSFLAF